MHQYIQYVNKYVGKSTDTKPVTADVKEGSDLWEADTGHEFKYSKGVWYPKSTQIDGGSGDGSPVSVQNPFPVDGDSVYEKDLNLDSSSLGTFTGDLATLFNDYGSTEITDETATNPKTFTLLLKRPIKSNTVAMGSLTGTFSNVKIQLKDLSGTVRTVVDDSADNTKHTSNLYSFTTNVFIEAVIEFHTADDVKISGMYIPKVQSRAISAIDGYISETNSTQIPLAADTGGSDHIFTGTIVDTLNYGMVVLSLKSDQASATDGLSVQFSIDRVNWDHIDVFTIPADSGKTFSFQTAARFMRVVYTNGVVQQTYFRMQVQLKPVYVKPSSHRVADPISGQDDAELVKAVQTGKKPNGVFVNAEYTAGGNPKSSVEEFDESLTTPNADRTTNLDGEIGLNTNAMMFGRVSDTVIKNARLDAITEAFMTITYAHHEVHAGSLFCAVVTGTENSGNAIELLLTPPALPGKEFHLVWAFNTQSEGNFSLIEDVTDPAAGTAFTPNNHNRNSANTSSSTLSLYGTETGIAITYTGGTTIWNEHFGAGKAQGAEVTRGNEWIIKNEVSTVFRLESEAATNEMWLAVVWYEHTARNN